MLHILLNSSCTANAAEYNIYYVHLLTQGVLAKFQVFNFIVMQFRGQTYIRLWTITGVSENSVTKHEWVKEWLSESKVKQINLIK